MTKRYLTDLIFAVVFAIALLISLGMGIFYIVKNNPVAIRNDLQRLSDFDSISYKVETYNQENGKLPSTMKDIDDDSKSYAPYYSPSSFFVTSVPDYASGSGKSLFKDPKSKEYYTIEKSTDSAYDYKLCTTFESDWSITKNYKDGGIYSDSYVSSSSPSSIYYKNKPNYEYKKGTDCIDFKLTRYDDLPYPIDYK